MGWRGFMREELCIAMKTEILETAAISVSVFLIKKYVFLEPDMEQNFSLSVYSLRGIIHAASIILCEREKLAQVVLGDYAGSMQ